MRQLRITSSRAPFRRSGLLIASVREPLTIGEFDLTGEQLVRVLLEPAFSIETRADEEGDWEPLPKFEGQLGFPELQALAQAHDTRRAEFLNSKAPIGDDAQSGEGASSAGPTGASPAGATDGAGTQSTGAPDAARGAALQSEPEGADKPNQSETEQGPAPIVETQPAPAPAPQAAKPKRGAPKRA